MERGGDAQSGQSHDALSRTLSADDQAGLREAFRWHWQERVAFNKTCGITVSRWDPEGVVFELPFRDDLAAHEGVFHGGVLSTLVDTSACGAVMAGHDFHHGSRMTTISMSVQYLSVAPGEGAVAEAWCTRRGRTTHYSEVKVRSSASNKLLVQGIVVVNTGGHRHDFDRILARVREQRGAS